MAFEMNELQRILRVSWTAKKTNEWVVEKAGVTRSLLQTVKQTKLSFWAYKQQFGLAYHSKGIRW